MCLKFQSSSHCHKFSVNRHQLLNDSILLTKIVFEKEGVFNYFVFIFDKENVVNKEMTIFIKDEEIQKEKKSTFMQTFVEFSKSFMRGSDTHNNNINKESELMNDKQVVNIYSPLMMFNG